MAMAQDANFTFVHFTDTHIIAGEHYTSRDDAWSLDTADTLERVIRAINHLETRPAFVCPGQRMIPGTRKPPSYMLPFPSRNGALRGNCLLF